MAGPNFVLISELQTLTRRDFPLADPTLLNPASTTPLIDGEWLELDSNYKLVRGSADPGIYTKATNTTYKAINVFPVHTERGRYDTQAIGKANVLYLGQYEAETTVITGNFVLGEALAVTTSSSRRVLAAAGTTPTSGTVIVGYVTKVMTGKIRFVHWANVLFP